jgi:hypothetical protein
VALPEARLHLQLVQHSPGIGDFHGQTDQPDPAGRLDPDFVEGAGQVVGGRPAAHPAEILGEKPSGFPGAAQFRDRRAQFLGHGQVDAESAHIDRDTRYALVRGGRAQPHDNLAQHQTLLFEQKGIGLAPVLQFTFEIDAQHHLVRQGLRGPGPEDGDYETDDHDQNHSRTDRGQGPDNKTPESSHWVLSILQSQPRDQVARLAPGRHGPAFIIQGGQNAGVGAPVPYAAGPVRAAFRHH